LSTTNPTWPNPGSKPGTNRLSYGTTLELCKCCKDQMHCQSH
jgi:hypothetical protein